MSHNTWIHRLARLGVKPLRSTPITPNQLTTLRLGAGIAAAGLYALGPPWHTQGALLFLLSMLLDRADGELARISSRTSSWGHTYDLISDGICNSLIFVGIGFGLQHSVLGSWSIPMGIVAGTCIALVLFMTLRIERSAGQRAAELNSFAGFDADDAMLITPVMTLFDWTVPLLIAACVGAPAFAIIMLWHFRAKLGSTTKVHD